MRRRTLAFVASAVLLLLLGGVPAAGAGAPDPVAGSFTASIDFGTLTLQPVGANCRLSVDGELAFAGSLVGTASASTTALVFAPCIDVATNPPGSFRDIFRSVLDFEGYLDGHPVTAQASYQGRTAVGGTISAVMVFFGDLHGTVMVDGVVATGGVYSGSLVTAP